MNMAEDSEHFDETCTHAERPAVAWLRGQDGSFAHHGRWYGNGRGQDLLSDVAEPHRGLVQRPEALAVGACQQGPAVRLIDDARGVPEQYARERACA